MPKIVDHDRKRVEIARGAAKAIAEKGIGRVTMIDLAAGSGVTTGMILNYFENKDAVIEAALRISFSNIEARIEEQIASGSRDLAEILEVAVPIASDRQSDIVVWVSFWGRIATDAGFRALNARLHQDGAQIYARALDAAWQEAHLWPPEKRSKILLAISTLLFGLSAGGVTNSTTWSAEAQRAQLRFHLDLYRKWAAED